jgi:LacI family transcriptional regulator
VDTDGIAAMAGATQRLIGLGHRRIGLLNALPGFNYAHEREAGWRQAMQAAGLPATLRAEADPTEAHGEIAARALLLSGAPTALLCATDRLAAGAMRAVVGTGGIVGADVSVIGFDDLPFASYVHPRLTTIGQPVEEAGRLMVGMLRQILAGADPATLNAMLPTRLIVRGSDGPVAKDQDNITGDHHETPIALPS